MPRLSALLALVACLLIAGCAGFGSPSSSPTQTPTSTTSTSTQTPTSTATETPWDSTAPDLDHDVRVTNRLNHSVELRVFVSNGSGHHVYDENLTVEPGERTVYNTNEGNPDEYEQFRVVGVWNGTQEDTTLQMKNCHFSAQVTISEDDGLEVGTVLC